MKILITGGSGFIGTNLVDYYVSKGWNVKNIDLIQPKHPEAMSLWEQCDIRDYASLEVIFLEFTPDYIIHLAARTDLEGKTIDDYSANTKGVENVLKAASQLKNLKKLLITSSMLVCHTGYIPSNQHDYAPSTFYGESKVITEKLVWANRPNCDWAILRPTSMWGPWFGVPYRNFFDIVKAGKYFHIGHQSCTKTYGYIENAVYQIDQILLSPTLDEATKGRPDCSCTRQKDSSCAILDNTPSSPLRRHTETTEHSVPYDIVPTEEHDHRQHYSARQHLRACTYTARRSYHRH